VSGWAAAPAAAGALLDRYYQRAVEKQGSRSCCQLLQGKDTLLRDLICKVGESWRE
jgi:hypothetical protein